MQFSKNNNNSIIDEIFNRKCVKCEDYISRSCEGETNLSKISDYLEKIKKYSSNENSAEIEKYCDKIDSLVIKELGFWEKKFYKIGFIDGMRMAEDLKSETKFDGDLEEIED